jgi:formate dehydrogenase (NADP+) alpha subunit
MWRMVTLKINGAEISAAAGDTILKAAQREGIYIPHLCYHPKLHPIGSCRLCVVEIEGVRDPMASCTTPVREGIAVTTDSPNLQQLRRAALNYILLNHPLECPVCDKAGECRLQDLCQEFGITRQPFSIPGVNYATDYDSPLIEKHDARCVMCGRCVSICTEVQAVHAWEFTNHGYDARIATVSGKPLDCEFCGQCVSVCPVGALISRPFKYKARVWELQKTASVCPYCGTGCAVDLDVHQNAVVRVTSDDMVTHNRGNLCIRGSFGYGFIKHPDRLATPSIKKNGTLTAVPWDEALDYTAASLKALIAEHGPDSIAGLGSVHSANEDNYLFQKLFRTILGTNNIDSSARFGFLNGILPLLRGVGFPASTGSFSELAKSRAIMIIGSDFAVEMPVASLAVIQAARDHGARLIVAAPVGTKFDEFATTKLRYRSQTEQVLLAGMVKVIIERGLVNKKFVEAATTGFSLLKDVVSGISLAAVAERTGVPELLIEKAATDVANCQPAAIICGDFLLQQKHGAQAMEQAVNIMLLTGHMGKEGSGCFISAGRNNIQGLCDMGVMADMLPGYRTIADSEFIRQLWKKETPASAGVPATELIDAIESGKIKGLYLMGCDPLMSFPDAQRTRAALAKLKFLLVQDLFFTGSAQLAHALLPAAAFAEREGSVTSGERRIQWMDRAVGPCGNALPDWQIIQNLTRRFDNSFQYQSAGEIFQEIEEAVPFYKGAHRAVKKRNGLQWPVAEHGPVTPRLTREAVRGQFIASSSSADTIPADPAYPYTLLTGASLYHCGTLSTHAEGPLAVRPRPWVEINPHDAQRLGIEERDTVIVRSLQGEITAEARMNQAVTAGIVLAPNHFLDAMINSLFHDTFSCQVALEKKP